MFDIENLGQVIKQIETWEAQVYEASRQAAMGLSVKMLHHAIEKSAQYSGDFAANWKVMVNGIDTSFTPNAVPTGSRGWSGNLGDGSPGARLRIMGDPAAKAYALASNAGRLSGFKLGDTINISNGAEHDEKYAWKIEADTITFRPGNTGGPMTKAMEFAQAHYSFIGPAELSRLRRMKL